MASRGVNKVILVGNLGADPEVRFMPSGGAVANIRLATSESWRDKQTGETKENTEWHRVVFFNRLAEIAGEYLRKGSQVYIEGRIRTNKWQGQDGQDRYTTEIVANEMQMLGGRPGGGGGNTAGFDENRGGGYANQSRPAQQQPQQSRQYDSPPSPQDVQEQPPGPPAGGEFDDDIPF